MPTSAYRPLTIAEQIFHDLIWKPMIKVGEVWIEGQLPFLAIPVIKQLDEATIEAVLDAIYAQVVLVVDVGAIRLVNAEHQFAYDKAFEDLGVIADEKGTTSEEFKKAQDNALATLARFAHMGPK